MNDSMANTNTPTMTKRYEALDGIRALSFLGIAAMHVFGNAGYKTGVPGLSTFIPSLTNLVFLFMTISGFGMCCGYYNKIMDRKIDIVDFYKKRYKKILPFFAFLCLIDFVMSPGLNALYEVFANLTLCFGLIPNAEISVIGVGWFLGTVFAFYLLFPFFCFLISDKKRAWFSFAASIIMNYICAYYFDVNRKAIAYSFVYFMVGGMVFLYKDAVVGKKNVQIILIALLLVVVTAFYIVGADSVFLTLLMILINAIILLYGMGASPKSVLNSKPLKFLGEISFELYLCHMLIYRVIEKLHLLRLTSNELLNYLIVYVLVVIGAVIFAVLSKRLLQLLPRRES